VIHINILKTNDNDKGHHVEFIQTFVKQLRKMDINPAFKVNKDSVRLVFIFFMEGEIGGGGYCIVCHFLLLHCLSFDVRLLIMILAELLTQAQGVTLAEFLPQAQEVTLAELLPQAQGGTLAELLPQAHRSVISTHYFKLLGAFCERK
jgi:hypothetical protein